MKNLLTLFCFKEAIQKSSQVQHLLTSLFMVMVLSIVNVPGFTTTASAAELITEVSAVNIPFSNVEGFTTTYFAQGDVEVGDPEKYEALASWFDVTAADFANGYELIEGHTYLLRVWFYAKEGYVFADNCTATINGKIAEATWHSSSEYDYQITFTAIGHNCTESVSKISDDGLNDYYTCAKCGKYYEDAECTKRIESSMIEQYKKTIFNPSITVTAPVTGEVANNEATVGNSSLYSCEGHWARYSNGDMAVTGTFEENTTYYYRYSLTPKQSEHIISEYAYINGIECKKLSGEVFVAEFTTGDCTHTRITPVAKVDATCQVTGKEAYYECGICGRRFEDSTGQNEIADFASWGVISKTEHTAPDTWINSDINHWGDCKVCNSYSFIEDHDLSSNVTSDVPATFYTDGEKVTVTTCSKCDYRREKTEVIVAGKYIRESRATMTPASITSGNCANDLVFESLEAEKYTVELSRVIDRTDATLNIGGSYPKDKNFVAGHEYAIEMTFYAVEPYVYNADDITHSSTFFIDGNETMMSAAVMVSGSTFRRIELIAADATPTAIESINAEKGGKAIKIIENGKVVIILGDKKYDLSGREL